MANATGDSSGVLDAKSPPAVLAACYDEMRRMARRIIAGNALGRMLQPTELANEAAIRLITARLDVAGNRGHLLAVAARMMRQILVDEARRGLSAKRHVPTLVTVWPVAGTASAIDLGDLDQALKALVELSPIRAEVVELRFMLGMTVEETAAATGLSESTVKRHWQAARGWLLAHLADDAAA